MSAPKPRPPVEPLPIDAAIDDVRHALHQSRAVVIVAEPGAGKTTRVPPALLDAGAAIVLQPRRAAARAIARRIALEQGWTLGQEIGWQVRFERNFSPSTCLLVATEGILTARLQHDPLLSDFATVVLDEFHERSIHADLALALSKQAMQARDDLRVVVMSATIDAARISGYLGGCPCIDVPGRLHPLRVSHHPGLPVGDAVAQVGADTEGSILCFQPGAFEIQRAIAAIRPRVASSVEVLPLHGSLPSAEQERVLAPAPGTRRVIVCTNIAETSLTVPGVTAVVDAGLEKIARYDASRAIDTLETQRISQAAADQRAGRAGRIGPGLVYRLWDAADRLRPFRDPDVRRIDLAGPVLDVVAWGGDPRTLEWFEAPPAAAIDAALRLLERIGAVRGLALTDVGRRMLRLALPPRLARIVVAGGGSRAVVRAAAVLSERHFLPTRTAATSSDVLPVLDGWDATPAHVKEVARQVERAIGTAPVGPAVATAAGEALLRQALFAGYPDRVAQRREPHSRRVLMATGTGAVLSAESGVVDAEFVVALDVAASNRPGDPESRIRLASAVDREWLAPTGTDIDYRVDADGIVKAREIDRYDALRLAERPIAPDPDRAADVLAAEWLARPMSEGDQQLVRRLRFAGCEVDVAELARMAAYGARGLSAIDLARVLSPDLSRMLERHAPAMLGVPSGRHIKLEYGEDGTITAAVKLQELFGLAETPRIGPRHEPVLLALLAPNGRPVQMTRDLRSFWDRTYPEVRKELRGRYPRHPWPDDPWNAPPTHRTSPRR